MKKCFWKPLALVHKLEHSLTATTFYKKKLIPVHSGVIPVHSGVIPVHFGPFRCHSGWFRSIPVHSDVILVHSGPFRCHSGPFRSIPPHSGSFRSVSVFSNAPSISLRGQRRSSLGVKLSQPPGNSAHFRFLLWQHVAAKRSFCEELMPYLFLRRYLWRKLRENPLGKKWAVRLPHLTFWYIHIVW